MVLELVVMCQLCAIPLGLPILLCIGGVMVTETVSFPSAQGSERRSAAENGQLAHMTSTFIFFMSSVSP